MRIERELPATTVTQTGMVMAKLYLPLVTGFLFSVWGAAYGQTARIDVYPTVVQGSISPYVYGLGVEWVDNGNGMLDPATGTVRPAILNLLTPLKVPVWRFPGGILADYYHWKDGVGPQSTRPQRANPMDGSIHANTFGTDEFIAFCKAQNSQALITANFGTGTLSEVLDWQSYFTRAKFPVRLWEIGNEIYLAEPNIPSSIPGNDARIYKTATDYAAGFKQWASGLRKADPQALVGAIAGTANTSIQNIGWLNTLLSTASVDMDFVALHNSFAPLITGAYDYTNLDLRNNAYMAMYAQAGWAQTDAQTVQQQLTIHNSRANNRIAVTEHFPLFGSATTTDQLLAILDQSKTMGSALFTASLFHSYIRQNVWMANYNLASSPWFGALINDTPGGPLKTPTYYVYDLYRNHFGTTSLGVSVTSPTTATHTVGAVPGRSNVAFLDVIASRDTKGKTYLAVINRHTSQAFDTTVAANNLLLGTAVMVYTVSSENVNDINGVALTTTVSQANIQVHQSTWIPKSGYVYRFPPNSITVLSW